MGEAISSILWISTIFMGGGGSGPPIFMSFIILKSCKLHLFMNFVISWHHEAVAQHFHDFHQFIIPGGEWGRGAGEDTFNGKI